MNEIRVLYRKIRVGNSRTNLFRGHACRKVFQCEYVRIKSQFSNTYFIRFSLNSKPTLAKRNEKRRFSSTMIVKKSYKKSSEVRITTKITQLISNAV